MGAKLLPNGTTTRTICHRPQPERPAGLWVRPCLLRPRTSAYMYGHLVSCTPGYMWENMYHIILALTRAYPCTEVSEPDHGETLSSRSQTTVCLCFVLCFVLKWTGSRELSCTLSESEPGHESCLMPCLEVDPVRKVVLRLASKWTRSGKLSCALS